MPGDSMVMIGAPHQVIEGGHDEIQQSPMLQDAWTVPDRESPKDTGHTFAPPHSPPSDADMGDTESIDWCVGVAPRVVGADIEVFPPPKLDCERRG